MDTHLLSGAIRTMTVILGGLVAGYCLRKSGRVEESFAAAVNRFALMYLQPVVIGLALWTMGTMTWRTLMLPVYGALLIVLMWPVSGALGKILPMDQSTRGSFVTSGMFSNVGFTYGTFLAYVALGPIGAALGALYCVSFMPMFFTLGFYTGRRYSTIGQTSILKTLAAQARDPQTRNPVLGIALGLLLNVIHLKGPTSAPELIDLLMPTTTAAFLLAIGLGLRLSAMKQYWRESLLLHGLKFIITPLVGLALAAVFGYWQMADHSMLTVVFIEAATPAAIMAVMLSEVFSLNTPLAGALWLSTNISAVILAPLVLFIARHL